MSHGVPVLKVRLDADQRERLDRTAEAWGVTISEVIRVLIGALPKEPQSPAFGVAAKAVRGLGRRRK
jgi:hypothetical protein